MGQSTWDYLLKNNKNKPKMLSETTLAASQAEQKREIICSTCHIKFDSVVNYKLHLSTEFHLYNTKRRMAGLAPISEDIFEEKKAQMVSANASAISEVVYKCQACNKIFKSAEQMEEHKKSKKHKKAVKEFMKQNPGSDTSSLFQSISQN